MPGWRNDKCNKKCSNGTFGNMCEEECSGNCLSNETCYHVDGHCLHGCQSGFQGEKCDAPCDLGHFGKNCSQICSVNCYDKCDNINGQCKCKRGWMGRNCSEVCSSGYYGVNCEERCSVNCLRNESCNVKNGSCPSGCQEDYEGDTCQRLKGPALNTSEKNKENVIYGVVSGVVLVIVLVVVIFIWRRRTSPASKGTDGSQQSFEFVLHSTKEDKLTNGV
ncbi:multiple epidermal growth factor-like domains protein 11 [Saccostrea echinata]|uniref:multiple epidermal growth factor-like domains protein 11 n=1 Tax=Saccostrea echinata TaxID=191078 RepID=UPI002A82B6A7|nr:multiple epidermal growth factor-like domains protein 11 [Saccostrea echinata]